MAFAERLQELKAQSGKSWPEIAEALGHKTPRYLMALAAGRYEPRQQTVRELAEVFGVTPAEMLGE